MLRLWRDLPIRWLFSLTVAVLILAVVSFQVLYFPARQADAALDALRTKGRTVAELLAHNVRVSMEYNDLVMTEMVFQGAKQDADLAYLVALKANGDVFASLNPGLAPKATGVARINGTEATFDAASQTVIVRSPVQLEGGEVGQLLAGFSTQRLQDELARMRVQSIAVGLAVLVGGVLIGLWVGALIGRPVQRVTGALERLAAGDLGQALVSDTSQSEIGIMGASFNQMIIELRKIVSRLRSASLELNESAEEILAASQEQEQGSGEQTASIEEVSRSIAGVAETARAIAERGNHLAQIADEMLTYMQLSQSALSTARNGMTQIVQHQDIVVNRISKLYEQSQAVISVVDIIDDISDRLDLLALNAALEGSRAGELGKGFSLVAQEMRRLAENVIGSTKEIKDTIQEIQRLTQASLEASQQGSTIVGQGAAEMEKMAGTITKMFDLIEKGTGASREIGVITQQQLSSTEQTVKAMHEMGTISAQSSRAARQVTLAASALSDLSVNIQQTVAAFTLDGNEPAPVTRARTTVGSLRAGAGSPPRSTPSPPRRV